MSAREEIYEDRRDAGGRLAGMLADERAEAGIVVGLARGGVEVAAPIARALGFPLEALAVRKIGHPWQPEFALGAVTPDGTVYMGEWEDIHPGLLASVTDDALRRARLLDARLHPRGEAHVPDGATCIIVDDGLATGATMVAAARWARANGARRVVAAVPVASNEGLALLTPEVDRIVCPLTPASFRAVGAWYRSFDEVGHDRVLALLRAAEAS